jgi:hypothetical protein
MKINKELGLREFKTWSGATETKEVIIEEGKEEEFEELIEELYPDGIDETQLNDILWFEEEWLFEALNIDIEEE